MGGDGQVWGGGGRHLGFRFVQQVLLLRLRDAQRRIPPAQRCAELSCLGCCIAFILRRGGRGGCGRRL